MIELAAWCALLFADRCGMCSTCPPRPTRYVR